MNLWSVVKSVLAALLGVQSKRNFKNDFSKQSPLPFIIVGIILTALFIAILLIIVKLVLGDSLF